MRRLFAIVDIETTGGYAADHGIIEVAVSVHDGEKVIETYETLLNPERAIPPYIVGFTGISNEMVESAPAFRDIAYDLFRVLDGKVFVAHNVNFDFSFIQHAFSKVGIAYNAPRICTVRLSRKIIPGFKSYSLGNLCDQLGIKLENAHRARGDCDATVVLFSKLLEEDREGFIGQSIRRNSGELNLPPNLAPETFHQLPLVPGVYFMHDASGKVIYVGKALEIRKRVSSHFTGKNASERKQSFLREIHDITYELCGNELVALLREAEEIKRLWPKYNRAMKRPDLRFGLFEFEDQKGIRNLGVEKVRPYTYPLISFSNLFEANAWLQELIQSYGLERRYCGLEKFEWADGSVVAKRRLESREEIETYNRKVEQALASIAGNKESFILIGKGRDPDEQSIVLVYEGRYRGYGFVHRDTPISGLSDLENCIREAKEYAETVWLIRSYLQRNAGEKIIRLDAVNN